MDLVSVDLQRRHGERRHARGAGRRILFVFLDGVGIGSSDPGRNPIAAAKPRLLTYAAGDGEGLPLEGRWCPTDAGLGVPGLPQSATGQTSLFCGVNAARLVGRHWPGFPTKPMRRLLEEASLFRRLRRVGKEVAFANAFSPSFFSQRPCMVSATTAMTESAGVPLRTFNDLRAGRALYMDFTNRRLRRRSYEVPALGPKEAAAQLVRLAGSYDLTLYEYFLTDLVAHRGSFEDAVTLVRELDEFLLAVAERAGEAGISLLISSDHGNLEDASSRMHTGNPVGTAAWGAFAEKLPLIKDLTDVTPLIEAYLTEEVSCRGAG